jgi:hypothetical protein
LKSRELREAGGRRVDEECETCWTKKKKRGAKKPKGKKAKGEKRDIIYLSLATTHVNKGRLRWFPKNGVHDG